MKFENYARDWLDRQTFSKSIRKTTRQSLDYICKAIGELEIEDISESDIDEIFYREFELGGVKTHENQKSHFDKLPWISKSY